MNIISSRQRRPRLLVSGAVMVGALGLLLTGCSPAGSTTGDATTDIGTPEPAAASDVYEFQTNVFAAGNTLTVHLPEALIEAATTVNDESRIDTLMVSEFRLKAHPLENAAYCAFDVEITYTESGKQALESMGDSPSKSFGYAISEFGEAKPMNEFSDTNLEEALYLSDDFSTGTFVQECATSPNDEDATNAIKFPVMSEQGSPTAFAEADINVMSSGTVGLVDGEVDDFERDSQGNWIFSS